MHHFLFENIVQLFIKFTHSFVAIGLLNFCKNTKKTILLLKRARGIPYVNRIGFLAFCVYKNVSQKKMYMNENYNDCHHQKTTCTFLYTQKLKIAKRFYIQKPYLFQKARQFPLCFYIQKRIYFTLRDFFNEFLKLVFLYKKHDNFAKYLAFCI